MERFTLSKKWENVSDRCNPGMRGTTGLCLSRCGGIAGQPLSIKMCLNYNTGLNTEAVPALKSEASLKSEMRTCM